MAATLYPRYQAEDIAEFVQCMNTLMTFLGNKRDSYGRLFAPTAYNWEISGVIDCIKGNKFYWSRKEELEGLIEEARKVASLRTNIRHSRKVRKRKRAR